MILLAVATLIAVLLVELLLNSGILFLLSKLFKISSASFKKSVAIFLASSLTTALVMGLLSMVKIDSSILPVEMSYTLALVGALAVLGVSYIAGFVVFYILLRKFYSAKLLKGVLLYIVFTLLAGALSLGTIFAVRSHLPVQMFIIEGNAMLPTYQNGSLVLLDSSNEELARTDVVVFSIQEPKYFRVGRVIGLPGERVEVIGEDIHINGKPLDESAYWSAEAVTYMDGFVLLKENEYFILGDNRSNSGDSRMIGPIKKEQITGKIFYILSK